LIPIGFGFGLAVYLKRKYGNRPPQAEANEASPAPEGVLDILKESGIAQELLLVKNNTEEKANPATSEENKLDEILQGDSNSLSEEQVTEQRPEPVPSDLSAGIQNELLARVLENFREFSPEGPSEEAKKSVEEVPKEALPKITKSTFENIPVYGVVPEELLETHLCLDQEILPDASPEVYDSFTPVPDTLFNRFEVDSPPGAEQFVQTQDAAIAIRKNK